MPGGTRGSPKKTAPSPKKSSESAPISRTPNDKTIRSTRLSISAGPKAADTKAQSSVPNSAPSTPSTRKRGRLTSNASVTDGQRTRAASPNKGSPSGKKRKDDESTESIDVSQRTGDDQPTVAEPPETTNSNIGSPRKGRKSVAIHKTEQVSVTEATDDSRETRSTRIVRDSQKKQNESVSTATLSESVDDKDSVVPMTVSSPITPSTAVKRGRGRPKGSLATKESKVSISSDDATFDDDKTSAHASPVYRQEDTSTPSLSPRKSRVRVPSRKLLESQQDDNLLKSALQQQAKKKRASLSLSASNSRTVSQSDAIDEPESEEPAAETDSESISVSATSALPVDDETVSKEPTGINEDIARKETQEQVDEFSQERDEDVIETQPLLTAEPPTGPPTKPIRMGVATKPAHRKRPMSQTIHEPSVPLHIPSVTHILPHQSIPSEKRMLPLTQIQHAPVAPAGSDLPEEHRPKERARPVMINTSSRLRTDVRKPLPQPARPYFQAVAGTSSQESHSIQSTDADHMMDEIDSGNVNDAIMDDHQTADVMNVNEAATHDGQNMGEVVEDGVIMDHKMADDGAYHVVDQNGRDIVYTMGEGDYVEEVEYSDIPDGMEVIEEREVQNEDGTTSIIQSVAPREPPPQMDNHNDRDMDDGAVMIKQEPGGGAGSHEDDDEAPPRLVPELGPTGPESARRQQEVYIDGDNMIRVQSPGGTQQFVHVARGEDGTEIYVDMNGDEVQMMEETLPDDLRTVEFNFLDSKNICCGLCGEIVPYDNLMSIHLPNMHPEVLGDGGMNLEEIPYETWLRDKLYADKKNMESGFRAFDAGMTMEELRVRGQRPLRKVSQIRVNPVEMTLGQLEVALKKKMIEKMGRKVPVALVDKQHARCGICNAVVSLNKKFEIVHLVRHFNAWHPSAHRCAGTWQTRPLQLGAGKPLSIQDFAVIDVAMDAPDNLQCIWCGMFMDRDALAMHFTEVHPDEIEVPRCLLCLQELVINARLLEKYGEDFEVVLPDEFHVKCHKFEQTYSSENALDKAIARRVHKMNLAGNETVPALDDEEDDDEPPKDLSYTNSRMQFGRRNKPKRQFVQPCFRQAIPVNSQYVEAVSECQWKCKLCGGNIFGAVISAGAIKHFKQHHPGEMENMQYELCKARLERVSDGCMEFIHPQLVECLICNLTYALHKPYNMCRGVRHLKAKHPEMMPEYTGSVPNANDAEEVRQIGKPPAAGSRDRDFPSTSANRRQDVQMGEVIEDPEMLARFKSEYNVDFERVQTIYGADGEPVYVLLGEGERLDVDTARQLATTLDDGENAGAERSGDKMNGGELVEGHADDVVIDEDDPYGDLAEDDEMNEMEMRGGTRQRGGMARNGRIGEDYGIGSRSSARQGITTRRMRHDVREMHDVDDLMEVEQPKPELTSRPSGSSSTQVTYRREHEEMDEEAVEHYEQVVYEDEHGQPVYMAGEEEAFMDNEMGGHYEEEYQEEEVEVEGHDDITRNGRRT